MTTLSEAIASAVAAHDYVAGNHLACLCGWWPVASERAVAPLHDLHRAHLTTAIAAAVEAMLEAERAEDRARLAAVERVLVEVENGWDDRAGTIRRVRAALAATADPEPTP